MSTLATGTDTLPEIAQRIGREIAAVHADAVDREARFPVEAIDALRTAGALGAALPVAHGGEGASLAAVAGACFELGRSCGATGMVFAMHQIQVFSLARHAEGSEWIGEHLRRVAAEQRLIASVTSEVGTGGDMGRSVAPVEPDGDRISFSKCAPTVSYGAQADDLLITLRRSAEAEPGDQVAVLVTQEQVELEPAGAWDPLGMRGTCSPGFVVSARCAPEQQLPVPFSLVARESLTPISHILWSHVWLGIATDAFDRARAFVRAAARQKPEGPHPAALRLSRLSSELSPLRAEVAAGLQEYTAVAEDDRASLRTMASALRFNNLKISSADRAPLVCRGAMEVCGIAGYRNDSPYSIGRHLRDAMSACLMVANERIHETDAGLLLVAKEV